LQAEFKQQQKEEGIALTRIRAEENAKGKKFNNTLRTFN
jgi:hypothetical protein